MLQPQVVEARVREILDERAVELAQRWLDTLLEHLPLQPERILPRRALFDPLPRLLRRILEAASGADLLSHDDVRETLRALARLRRSQGYTATELGQEFELLGTILLDEVERLCQDHEREWSPACAVAVTRQLQQALVDLAKGTIEAFELETCSDLKEDTQLLDSFGRAVTHELRNRLNAVRLALDLHEVQLRQNDRETPEVRKELEGLKLRLQRIESVVEDVFVVAIAHRQANLGEQSFRPFADVVRTILGEAEVYARDREVELRVSEALPRFTVDAVRVGLILMNLINNAIKYSDPTRTTRWVELSATRLAARRWKIEIRDNGLGIPAHQQQKIFEPYNRGEAPRGVEGEGLGLPLAQRAAAQLGSELVLDSVPGEGSCFSFELRESVEKEKG
jgi:signal transduction histidine kinase